MMKRFQKTVLNKVARPDGWIDRMLACAVEVGEDYLVIDDTDTTYLTLVKEYREFLDTNPPTPQHAYVPDCQKPFEVPVDILTDAERVALGDLIAAGTRMIGIDTLAYWVKQETGVECGCSWRHDLLNRVTIWRRKKAVPA